MNATALCAVAWGLSAEESDLKTGCIEVDQVDIQASLKGDGEAYARLVKRYQPYIFSQMWNFTRDPHVQDELVQEVFVEVYRSLKNFKARAPFLHWIRRIATRVGYHHWKRKSKDQRLHEALGRQLAVPPPEEQAPSDAAEYLHELLARLNVKDRLVLNLIYFEECDAREIAERMGWNENLVRVRAHRARQKLRKLLEEAGFSRQNHA